MFISDKDGVAVYVARVGESGPIKIGVSCNPRRRMGGINTCLPSGRAALVSYLWIDAPHARLTANDIESKAHHLLGHYHTRGEWFNCSADIAISAIDRCVADRDKCRWVEADVRPTRRLSWS